ncbi:MAG: ArdC-like ssDNA-binding domain-containing protein [Eubacterium sp.]
MPEKNSYPSQYEKVKSITDQLEAGIKALFESDSFRQYLQTMSKFHDYSLNNTILIAMQKPDATLVAGYTSWQKQFGRQVQKGEKGIRILAPTPYKKRMEVEKKDPDTGAVLKRPDGTSEKETKEVLIPAFKVVNVFDVSQTDGKPLPSLGVNELTGDVAQYEMFFEALKHTCPVPIRFEQIEGGAKGYFHTKENRIAIQEGMSQVQTIKTAIHEMTHQALHSVASETKPDSKMPKLTRNVMETEAEAVAFTVCSHYGIDTGDYSFPYLVAYSSGKSTPELKASLDKIRRTASEMITSIDEELAVLQKTLAINTDRMKEALPETQGASVLSNLQMKKEQKPAARLPKHKQEEVR